MQSNEANTNKQTHHKHNLMKQVQHKHNSIQQVQYKHTKLQQVASKVLNNITVKTIYTRHSSLNRTAQQNSWSN